MSADDLTETLAAWKATTDAATEGPWHVIVHENEDGDWDYSDLVHDRTTPSGAIWRNQILGYVDLTEADAEFIALSRTIVPALLSAVEGVLALCSESDNRRSPFVYASEVRKALTDALEVRDGDYDHTANA